MESKSFAKALQELKNLRPQLYSAAEYCEKSYVHNEQKQMVLDNLKDYAVKALVNAVDHLGIVAYKLGELLEQQTLHASALDLKFVCLDQRLLTCQSYTDKEGLREQQFSITIPRLHKHYLLPGLVNKRLQTSTTESGPKYTLGKPRAHGSGTPAPKTLCWHLASETKSCSNDASPASARLGSTVSLVALGAARQDSHDPLKTLTTHKSFDSGSQRLTPRPPVRSKSMLSTLFGKTKSVKHKTNYASFF
ncbi:hypothetical protein EJ110_NYTH14136 [Nymphaea thermarum]|nr:hypothetical protein EJ110_NYTH14136 [Nymphaea thermarum]